MNWRDCFGRVRGLAMTRLLANAMTGILLTAGWLVPPHLQAESKLCALVKMQISQEATLEREAFDANLQINNTLPQTPLTDLNVQISIKDSEGNPADDLFFIRVNSLEGVTAIDGTGVVQPASTADIHWLIIPSTGAGGADSAGKRYSIKAAITALSGTDPQNISTFDAFITVKPQPVLRLEYALPFNVFADEPLTETVERPEPFDLAVRVTNIGHGVASNFKIESAQPRVVDNQLALPLNVKILGTALNGVSQSNSLLIPLGTLNSGQASIASWVMSTNLSGRFEEFASSFSHAAELGGQLTSLIQSVATSTLIRKVKVDAPGRDDLLDLLVSFSADRSKLQDYLNGGNALAGDSILESDKAQPTQLISADSVLSGVLGGPSTSLTLSLLTPPASGSFIETAVPYSYESLVPTSVRRSDGKVLNPSNFWISKHFNKSDVSITYHFNLFDFDPGSAFYTLNFDPVATDLPPGAVTDLSVSSGAENGQLTVHWTAPGEDGYAGSILAGRFMIQVETDSSAVFTPALAGIDILTSASPGDQESYLLSNLAGNASYFMRLWAEDTGRALSAASNLAVGSVRPFPPSSIVLSSGTETSLTGQWASAKNLAPIEYALRIATEPSAPALQEKFFGGLGGDFTFADLLPGTSYFISGFSRNPITLDSSEIRLFASTATSPHFVPVDIDTMPPSIAILSPVSGIAVIDTVTVSGTAFDNLALAFVEVQIDTDTFELASGTASWTFYWDTAQLKPGTHTVTARAVDLSGNQQSTSIAVSAAINLVENPGFEEGKKAWDFPSTASIDEQIFHAGHKSAKLTRKRGGGSYILSEPISVQSRSIYKASIWVKRDEVKRPKRDHDENPDGVKVLVRWFDARGKKISANGVADALLGTSDWTRFEKTLKAPRKAAFARLKLSIHDAKGTAWFDDAILFKSESTIAQPAGAPELDTEEFSSDIEDDDAQDPDGDIEAAPFIDPAFKLGEYYSFPNPASNGRNPIIHLECGIADYVDIRIYDVTGALMHESHLDGLPQVVDGKYAYEHTWDAAGAGSGVYYYFAVAKKEGEKDIRVRKKLAIMK